MSWLDDISGSTDSSLSKLWEMVKDREVWCAAFIGSQRIGHDWATEQQPGWRNQHLQPSPSMEGAGEAHTLTSPSSCPAGSWFTSREPENPIDGVHAGQSPGKGGGVGRNVESGSRGGVVSYHCPVARSCLALCHPTDCSTLLTTTLSLPAWAPVPGVAGPQFTRAAGRRRKLVCQPERLSQTRWSWPSSSPQIACSALIRNFLLGNLLQASQVALVVKNPLADAGDVRGSGSIPGSGSSLGGGHGNPL